MPRHRGSHKLKIKNKIRHVGDLLGLSSKKSKTKSDLRNQLRPNKKKSQYHIRFEEKTKMHPFTSYRTTITYIP